MGLIAHTCVEATVRYAAELGYEVTMVKDATADYANEQMHAALDVNFHPWHNDRPIRQQHDKEHLSQWSFTNRLHLQGYLDFWIEFGLRYAIIGVVVQGVGVRFSP
jgi:hypothetical protein